MEVRERLPCVHCMLWCMQCTHHLLTFLVLMLCWSKWYLSQHQQQETDRHGRSFCCSGCFCLCCRCCLKKKKQEKNCVGLYVKMYRRDGSKKNSMVSSCGVQARMKNFRAQTCSRLHGMRVKKIP